MFKTKLIISFTILISFLVITSTVKNKTRVIEKQITNLNKKILLKRENINEAQLDFFYLSTPIEIEKKLANIGYNHYQPIEYSNIFYNVSDFIKIHNNISNLKDLNEKKIQKK